MTVGPDRVIKTARVDDQDRYNVDSDYRAAADRALRCKNSDLSCQTMSDFEGFDMAGGKSGLESHSRLIR